MESGGRRWAYNLVTTLAGLNVTDFTHFDGEMKRSKRFLDASKTKIPKREAERGGIEFVCVCMCVLLAFVCVSIFVWWDFGTVCFGWLPSQRTPEIWTDIWQMKTLPPETAYISLKSKRVVRRNGNSIS